MKFDSKAWVLLIIWCLTPFQQYFNFIAAVSASINAFLEFFLPVLHTKFFLSHWLNSHITIDERWERNESVYHQYSERILAERGSNQWPPVLKSCTLRIELWGSAQTTGREKKKMVKRREYYMYFIFQKSYCPQCHKVEWRGFALTLFYKQLFFSGPNWKHVQGGESNMGDMMECVFKG